jgi:hypothetical protein
MISALPGEGASETTPGADLGRPNSSFPLISLNAYDLLDGFYHD